MIKGFPPCLKTIFGEHSQLQSGMNEASTNGELVKDEEETLLVRTLAPSDSSTDPGRWWKLYRVPLRRRCFAWIGRSRARREGAALRRLAELDLPCVEVHGVAEHRCGPLLCSSLLVTNDCAGGTDLRMLLRQKEPPPARRKKLMEMAGRAARRLHDAGIVHFRMQLRNVLALAPDDSPCWLDAPYACDFRSPVPKWLRAVDLVDLVGAQSIATVEDARTVLLAYADRVTPPISLERLRARTPFAQKLRRIGGYVFAINSGRRIRLTPPQPAT